MAGITFDELWEELKNEDEESRQVFKTAEDIAKVINQLTEERVRQGLTQRDLAKRCGLKQSAIARMESVKSIPRLDTVMKIADALGLELQLENKTRVESVTFLIPGGVVGWRNTNTDKSPYQYKEYNEYPVQAIA